MNADSDTPVGLADLPYYLYKKCAANRLGVHTHILPEGWTYTDYADYAHYRRLYRGEG